MRFFLAACFCLILWTLCPFSAQAGESQPSRSVLLDEEGGYFVPLSEGWLEVSDPEALREILRRAGVIFAPGGEIPGARHLRGAAFPDEQGKPVLAAFALDYALLGINDRLADIMAEKTVGSVASPLADALIDEYQRNFPQSVVINASLRDDNFFVHLRSVLDPDDESGSARHRYLKMVFAADAVVAIVAQYDGEQNMTHELNLARIMRESSVIPTKNIRTRLPPQEVTWFDYILVPFAIFFVFYCFRRFFRWMKT
ncbi:MAG: hypothetical protein FWF99_02205 [Desulfovibrionaceae bacterium]|nr:hypothetical protein [Desulfovibrionaceae bacterium]